MQFSMFRINCCDAAGKKFKKVYMLPDSRQTRNKDPKEVVGSRNKIKQKRCPHLHKSH